MNITVRINGRDVELTGPTPLPEYLDVLGVDARAVAVELNERILERSELPAAVLHAGDVVEIVRMVGGGSEKLPVGDAADDAFEAKSMSDAAGRHRPG